MADSGKRYLKAARSLRLLNLVPNIIFRKFAYRNLELTANQSSLSKPVLPAGRKAAFFDAGANFCALCYFEGDFSPLTGKQNGKANDYAKNRL